MQFPIPFRDLETRSIDRSIERKDFFLTFSLLEDNNNLIGNLLVSSYNDRQNMIKFLCDSGLRFLHFSTRSDATCVQPIPDIISALLKAF